MSGDNTSKIYMQQDQQRLYKHSYVKVPFLQRSNIHIDVTQQQAQSSHMQCATHANTLNKK